MAELQQFLTSPLPHYQKAQSVLLTPKTLQATGGTTPYTWLISAGSLPIGLSLNSSTGVISGTPTAQGISNLTVQVQDSASNTDTQALSITINPQANNPPTAQASANPTSGTVPLTVNFTGSGTDTDGSIVSYSWNFGDGGTSTQQNPTHIYDNAGSYTATLTVTDDDGATETDTVTITVEEVPPLTITTTSLPNGTVGSSYSKTLQASGGISPYTWSLVSGNLPDGLSLNVSTGVISGIPTTEGTSNLTVQVQDSASSTDTQALSIISNSPSVSTLDLTAPNTVTDLIVSEAATSTGQTTTSASSTIEDLTKRFNELKAFLQVLIAEILKLQQSSSVFTRNLSYGSNGEDVKQLQRLLISEGLLSSGLDTGWFGSFTKTAVIKFQEKHADAVLKPANLQKGTGYVGKMTLIWVQISLQ